MIYCFSSGALVVFDSQIPDLALCFGDDVKEEGDMMWQLYSCHLPVPVPGSF